MTRINKEETKKILNKILDLLLNFDNWDKFHFSDRPYPRIVFGVEYKDKDYIEIEERYDVIYVTLDVTSFVYKKGFLDCLFGASKLTNEIFNFHRSIEFKLREQNKIKTLNRFLGEK